VAIARALANHPDLLASKANLATLRFYQGRPAEAVTLIEDVLAQRLLKDPPYRYDLVIMLCNLANFVRARGDGDEGVRTLVARVLDAGVGEHAETMLAVVPLENLARYLENWDLQPRRSALVDEAALARARQPPADPTARRPSVPRAASRSSTARRGARRAGRRADRRRRRLARHPLRGPEPRARARLAACATSSAPSRCWSRK
jgi:hypothetical protein